MSAWFVSRTLQKSKREIQGPFHEAQIISDLRAGRLTALDLIFSVEENCWKTAAEYEVFRQALSIPVSTSSDSWIVLMRTAEGFTQSGPHSVADILARIRSGDISYSDSVWREGEPAWTRIGDRREFQIVRRDEPLPPAVDKPDLLSQIAQLDTQEILRGVLRISRDPAPSFDPDSAVPKEADGVELIGKLGRALSLLLIAGSCALSLDLPRAHAQLQPEPAFPQAPKNLDVIALKPNSANPVLVFQTDAPVHEPIRVTLSARSGEILKLASFRRSFHLVRKPGEIPTINLGSLQLPAGTYQVEATAAGLEASKTIFLGVRDEKFEADLEKHLKAISQQQQAEKKALFYSAKSYESLARQLDGGFRMYRGKQVAWQSFYKSWKANMKEARQPLAAYFKPGRQELAFPEEIKTVQAALHKLDSQAQELDSAIKQKREIAQAPETSQLAQEFARLKEMAAQLRGRARAANE